MLNQFPVDIRDRSHSPHAPVEGDPPAWFRWAVYLGLALSSLILAALVLWLDG